MAAAAAPMGLAGYGTAGLSSFLHEGLSRAIELAGKPELAAGRPGLGSRGSKVQTVLGTWHGATRVVTQGHELRLAIGRSAASDPELDRAFFCRLPDYPNRSRERDAAIDSIAGFSERVAVHTRKKSSEAMSEAITALYANITEIKAHFTQLTDTPPHTYDGVSHIAKAASSQDGITGKRIEAKLRFTSD